MTDRQLLQDILNRVERLENWVFIALASSLLQLLILFGTFIIGRLT